MLEGFYLQICIFIVTYILSRVWGVHMTIMTGSSSDDWILLAVWLQPLVITLTYSAITIPHTLQSTVAHALGFSVSTSGLLATGLNTETNTSNHYEVFLSLLQSPWNANQILRF
jgi:hypothetical protein